MTLSAEIDASALTVLLDLRHPLSYIALSSTRDFARSEGLAINWLPLVSPPLNPPSQPQTADDRGVRHRRHRANAIAREIGAYSAARGLLLRECYRDGDASAANLAWLWMRDRHPGQQGAFLAELFRAYWALELDASKPEAVAALVASQGADPKAFLAWSSDDGPASAALLEEELRGRGLFGVPAYLIEDEVFYGRQHLPMIGWILAGRSGPVPI